MSKYNNVKTVVDGITFDSQKEAKRYNDLKILQRLGHIRNLVLQPRYELQPSFKKGKTYYRKIEYVADFQYFDTHLNKIVVEDVKGMKTDVYKLKKKMFEYQYPDLELKEVWYGFKYKTKVF